VREWFGERLKQRNEAAWKAGHGRIYEHLRDKTEEGGQPTLEGLAPLYQAIGHGCRADRYQEALDDIYVNRICRRTRDGKIEFYARNRLGTFGSDLSAISWFFEQPYEVPFSRLTPSARSWVIGEAASCLRAQARFAEALPAMRAAMRMTEVAKTWENAAARAILLSETELLVGDVATAVTVAERSVGHADCGGGQFLMVISRVSYAHALHIAGRRADAERLFIDAEQRHGRNESEFPQLYSVQGYQYCDLLLAKREYGMARDRAVQNLLEFQSWYSLLSKACDILTVGRAHLGLALEAIFLRHAAGALPAGVDSRAACVRLDEAIDGFRVSGESTHIPDGLLVRVCFRRNVGDWGGAERALDETEEIGEQGPMRLYLCDTALERARLAFARIEGFAPLNGMLERDNPPKPTVPTADQIAQLKNEAEKQLKIAADYIEKCGYHRRDEELAELQAVLRGEKSFTELPPRV
jgi:hypothetical protein